MKISTYFLPVLLTLVMLAVTSVVQSTTTTIDTQPYALIATSR